MRVLLTGAQGNLGTQIAQVFSAAGHDVLATERAELDITDEQAVLKFVAAEKLDVIINAAAYNFVDKVEDSAIYPLAYAVNALGPKNLAMAAKQADIPLVHYSTDYVFAGDKPEGYVESDATGPISKYGETKAEGERFVVESGAKYYLCRLSKIFGPAGLSDVSKPSFVSLMLRLAKEKPELRIVDEEVGMPTYTLDVAVKTLEMIEEGVPFGIYHIVNDGHGVSWYGFAEEIFNLADVTTPRIAVPSSEFPRPAKAPKFAALRNTKLPPLRSRQSALAEYMPTINQ